jgi:hypothetical protein
MKKLLTFSVNWADEMDVYSIAVVDDDIEDDLDSEDVSWPIEMYIGTNQDVEIYRSDFHVEDIPDGLDSDVLEKVLEKARVHDLVLTATDYVWESIEQTRGDRLNDISLEQFEVNVIEHLEQLPMIDPIIVEQFPSVVIQLDSADTMPSALEGHEGRTFVHEATCDDCRDLRKAREDAMYRALQKIGGWEVKAGLTDIIGASKHRHEAFRIARRYYGL